MKFLHSCRQLKLLFFIKWAIPGLSLFFIFVFSTTVDSKQMFKGSTTESQVVTHNHNHCQFTCLLTHLTTIFYLNLKQMRMTKHNLRLAPKCHFMNHCFVIQLLDKMSRRKRNIFSASKWNDIIKQTEVPIRLLLTARQWSINLIILTQSSVSNDKALDDLWAVKTVTKERTSKPLIGISTWYCHFK